MHIACMGVRVGVGVEPPHLHTSTPPPLYGFAQSVDPQTQADIAEELPQLR